MCRRGVFPAAARAGCGGGGGRRSWGGAPRYGRSASDAQHELVVTLLAIVDGPLLVGVRFAERESSTGSNGKGNVVTGIENMTMTMTMNNA